MWAANNKNPIIRSGTHIYWWRYSNTSHYLSLILPLLFLSSHCVVYETQEKRIKGSSIEKTDKLVAGENNERGEITLWPQVHDSTELQGKLQNVLNKKKGDRKLAGRPVVVARAKFNWPEDQWTGACVSSLCCTHVAGDKGSTKRFEQAESCSIILRVNNTHNCYNCRVAEVTLKKVPS
jgi:hypothetical protein